MNAILNVISVFIVTGIGLLHLSVAEKLAHIDLRIASIERLLKTREQDDVE